MAIFLPISNALSSVMEGGPSPVLDEERHAIDDAFTSGLRRQLHRLRIGGEEIGRTDRLRKLPHREVQFAPSSCPRRRPSTAFCRKSE
jgi:hypothetical protein